MKRNVLRWPLLAAGLLLVCIVASAQEVRSGVNSAGVIEFPTDLDQELTHVFHGSLTFLDVEEPDLAFTNLRYGFQLGNFQLLTDLNARAEPDKEFDFGEIRAKLRVLPLDSISTNIAVGFMGRFTDSDAVKKRLADRSASLFVILTSELFLFDDLDGVLLNFYLDNLNGNLGVKVPVFQFIKVIAELDYLHGPENLDDRGSFKAGIEGEGEQNFYFQLYYSDLTEHFVFQIGSGF